MGSSILWRDQLARMFQILLTLLSDRHPNARELSDECEVSRRTIYRDLQSLILAGVPIEFRSELGGYRVAPSFSEDHPRLDLRLVRSLASLPSYRVLIRVSTPLRSDLDARFPRPLTPVHAAGDVPEETRLEFTTGGLEQAVFELLAFAEMVEILEPPELRARLRDIATRIARRHAAAPPQDRSNSKPGAVAG
jgi:predicted DNA-binding transcriptional regulator YafY